MFCSLIDEDGKSAVCNPATAMTESIVDVQLAETWKNKYLKKKLFVFSHLFFPLDDNYNNKPLYQDTYNI